MSKQIEILVDAYSRGHLNRRQLLSSLGMLVAAAAAGGPKVAGAAEASTFKSRGLNHIALRVTDIGRSRDFYMRHFGVEVLRQGPSNCFLGVGGNNFVALFRSDTPGMDHYCYTIEGYDPDAAVETLKAAGFIPRRAEDRVYFDDPDGLEVQIASEWGDYPGTRS
jgi:catechol 2,3-dioxygenase-like lactoylglutathione lyase family enzyme